MNLTKLAVRALGKRLPTTRGMLDVSGIDDDVTIRRDRFGVPHIEAGSDTDAWFAVGFCQGQDRAFQIETRVRVTRGTLAALVGPDGLPIDRLSRRIGFARHGAACVEVLDPDHRRLLEAYAAGVRSGMADGLPRRPHEMVLLRGQLTPFEAFDALGFLAVMAFSLASNWDTELARLDILRRHGPEAVADLEPGYDPTHPVSDRPGRAFGGVLDSVAEDLAAFGSVIGVGGGSNNWAVGGGDTATGRPILSNDPHLAPVLPPHWYLIHVTTPEWSLAGASLVGTPTVAAGHNGRAAWGVTAGLIDNTDLFLERIGSDGRSVRRGDHDVPCDTRTEVIEVNGSDPVTIEVLETDRGPIVGEAFDGAPVGLSMAATWLDVKPLGAIFEVGSVTTFDDLRRVFADWASLPLNVAFAEEGGTIGWQLVGNTPVRKVGNGTVPLPAWDPTTGWEPHRIGAADLPHVLDPEAGLVATANNLPTTDGPHLGADFLDGYRVQRIFEILGTRDDWDVNATLAAHLDQVSLPWRHLREAYLETAAPAGDLGLAVELLRSWDGVVGPDSAAASVFELTTAALARLVAEARAPASAERALGSGFTTLVPFTGFAVRRIAHLVRLVTDRPDGWFEDGWDDAIRRAMRAATARLIADHGRDPRRWAWGEVRPLILRHPLGQRPPLNRVFDLGPFPHGGDANTVNPAPVNPDDPLGNPDFAIASLRMVIDVGDWGRSRFVLPGGQSGNPFSRHYGDQVGLWRRGDAFAMPWHAPDVARAARRTLVLTPQDAAIGASADNLMA